MTNKSYLLIFVASLLTLNTACTTTPKQNSGSDVLLSDLSDLGARGALNQLSKDENLLRQSLLGIEKGKSDWLRFYPKLRAQADTVDTTLSARLDQALSHAMNTNPKESVKAMEGTIHLLSTTGGSDSVRSSRFIASVCSTASASTDDDRADVQNKNEAMEILNQRKRDISKFQDQRPSEAQSDCLSQTVSAIDRLSGSQAN